MDPKDHHPYHLLSEVSNETAELQDNKDDVLTARKRDGRHSGHMADVNEDQQDVAADGDEERIYSWPELLMCQVDSSSWPEISSRKSEMRLVRFD